MWLRPRAGRLPRIRKSADASWKTPLVRHAVWLALSHYGQRSRVNVGCVTFHDLVYGNAVRFRFGAWGTAPPLYVELNLCRSLPDRESIRLRCPCELRAE